MSIVPDWWRDEDYLTPTPSLHCPSFEFSKPSSCQKAACSEQPCPALCPSPVTHEGLAVFRFARSLTFLISVLLLVSFHLTLPCFYMTQKNEEPLLCIVKRRWNSQSAGLQARVLTTLYQLPNPFLLDDIVFKARNTSCSAVTRALLPCKHTHASHLTQNRFLWNKTYLPASL